MARVPVCPCGKRGFGRSRGNKSSPVVVMAVYVRLIAELVKDGRDWRRGVG